MRDRRLASIIATQLVGLVFINGAGVSNPFSDTELVELVDDLTRLDFELPRQLIDSNLTHIEELL